MADEKLRGIVQNMIDNGESDEFINQVIAEYKRRNAVKTKAPVETDVTTEEPPVEETTEEVVEEEIPEMTLEQRQAENKTRQNTSYDDWLATQREDMGFWDYAGEHVGNFLGETSSVIGGLFEQVKEMTPLGDGKVEPIDIGWKKKQRRDREQR